MELGQLDEATAATDAALRLNPQNTIAHNLQGEIARRRAPADSHKVSRSKTPTTRTKSTSPARSGSGFGRPEFTGLAHLSPAAAAEALGQRIEALLMAINECPFAARMVEARNRAGRSGSRLFRRNSFYPGNAGHVFAFHHGGRWEPQIHLGWFAANTTGRDSLCAGIGF